MRHSLEVGFSFGSTSGIITTLGLMVGLNSGTHSKLAVIGGVLTIAVADAFSDALGIHISEEAENKHTVKQVWQSSLFTFLFKFLFALTFVIPILLFKLTTAIWISVVWGLFLLGLLSFHLTKKQKRKRWKVVLEHLTVAVAVITITHYLGDLISSIFG